MHIGQWLQPEIRVVLIVYDPVFFNKSRELRRDLCRMAARRQFDKCLAGLSEIPPSLQAEIIAEKAVPHRGE